MADETINIDVLINSANSAKSIRELTQVAKQLKTQLTEVDGADFSRLSEALNEVDGKLGDISDTAKTTAGSGIEKLNSSLGLLKEGFANADPGKIGIAFKGLGAAMSAIPIFLLIEGFKWVIDNFDTVVEFVKNATGAFSDEEIAVKQTTRALEAQKEITAALSREYDRQIAILEASGASDAKILEIKKKKIQAQILEAEATIKAQDAIIAEIKANDDLSESLSRAAAWLQRKLGNEQVAELYEKSIAAEKAERIKEEQTKREEAEQSILDLKNQVQILDIEYNKKQVETAKKTAEEKKKIAEQEGEDSYRRWKEEQERLENENNVVVPEQIQNINTVTDAQLEADRKLVESALKAQKEIDQAKKDKAESDKAILEAEMKGIDAARSLTEGFYAWKVRAAKGNADAELKIRKQMFAVDKAFNIARAIQDGIRSVQAALTIPPPGGQILAGVNAAIAAGNIAKIAATQFDAGGATGSADISAGGASVGGGAAPAVGNFTQPQLEKIGSGAAPGSGQKMSQEPIVKAFVVTQDITASQEKQKILESRTSF